MDWGLALRAFSSEACVFATEACSLQTLAWWVEALQFEMWLRGLRTRVRFFVRAQGGHLSVSPNFSMRSVRLRALIIGAFLARMGFWGILAHAYILGIISGC